MSFQIFSNTPTCCACRAFRTDLDTKPIDIIAIFFLNSLYCLSLFRLSSLRKLVREALFIIIERILVAGQMK